jgi:2,3,4,5-tetrahydropyridine-2-carboxylate N-succinyltransferase
VGVATVRAGSDKVLDVRYPEVALGADPGALSVDRALLEGLVGEDPRRGVTSCVVTTVMDLDTPPADSADAYLRLHLLSHRLVAPHGLSMDGIFATLNNVVWTSAGPCAPEDFETTRLRLLAGGQHVQVASA